jgi:hypothetical protein
MDLLLLRLITGGAALLTAALAAGVGRDERAFSLAFWTLALAAGLASVLPSAWPARLAGLAAGIGFLILAAPAVLHLFHAARWRLRRDHNTRSP